MSGFPIHRTRLLERFCRYVRVGTTADPASGTYPSSPGQWDLGKLLVEELRAMGLADAKQDEHGLVWGLVPATVPGKVPTVALIAHLDTSPEAPGQHVVPHVIERYAGGDIVLQAGNVISTKTTPELSDLIGKTLVTTDGNTLLGGDDKAGIAIIMELAHHLIEHPHLPHGPVQLLFTCDEEIGHGADHIDLEQVGAIVGYTLDGGGEGDLDVETFSADGALVTFTGHNIHPSIGKGRMINAVRAASEFVSRLPRHVLAPEATDGTQGFIHPYEIKGGVGQAHVRLILRSFQTSDLEDYARLIKGVAEEVARLFPGLEQKVEVQRQYRNLADGLRHLPQALDYAEQAFINLGRSCRRTRVRGGTDGSLLTEKGLPTPNLSSGQHNIHSVQEFVCLDEMVGATEHLVELLRLWQSHGRA